MRSAAYGGGGDNPPLDALEYNLLGAVAPGHPGGYQDPQAAGYYQQQYQDDGGYGGEGSPDDHPRGALDRLPTRPVPFQLRSVSNPDEVHRLRSATFIGRSGAKLRDCDVGLRSPDVSRVHAHIKVRGDDLRGWDLRIVDESSVSGTDVDGEPVPLGGTGKKIEVGCYLRFGAKELWVLERRALHSRASKISGADGGMHGREGLGALSGDTAGWQEVRVKTLEHHQAIRRVKDWYEIVELLVEMLNSRGKIPPCADVIVLYDDRGGYVAEHKVTTPAEMEEYPVREEMLKDIHLGHIIRLHLSSEPLLLAPLVERLERKRRAEEERRQNLMPSFG